MSNKTDKVRFEHVRHEWIHLRDLKVHPLVQRDLTQWWVDKLAAELDPDKFGELTVVRVPKETFFYVFDGQHRMQAANKAWGEDQRLPCAIYEDCDTERLAKKFIGQNTRLPVKALDNWIVRRLAADEKVLGIEKILEAHNLRADRSRAQGVVQAVAALERTFDRFDGATVARTLTILGGTWGRDPDAYDSLYIKSVSFLVNKFNGDMDDRDFIRKLKRDSDPCSLIGLARGLAHNVGMSVERAMSEKLVSIYNKGRTTKRLELR